MCLILHARRHYAETLTGNMYMKVFKSNMNMKVLKL